MAFDHHPKIITGALRDGHLAISKQTNLAGTLFIVFQVHSVICTIVHMNLLLIKAQDIVRPVHLFPFGGRLAHGQFEEGTSLGRVGQE